MNIAKKNSEIAKIIYLFIDLKEPTLWLTQVEVPLRRGAAERKGVGL